MRAIARGRLKAALTADGKIADPELADREWSANTDLTKAPATVKLQAAARAAPAPQPGGDDGNGGDGGDTGDLAQLATASAREKYWKAKSAELAYRERAGELVDAREMAAAIADDYSTVRTRMLAVPSRVKQVHAELPLEVLATIDQAIRDALEAVATTSVETSDDDRSRPS